MSTTWTIARMLAFTAVALLITQLTIVDGAATTHGGYLVCASCMPPDVECNKSCLGKWCYKSVLSTQDGPDVKVVTKRGCFNHTYGEIEIGCRRTGDEIANEVRCVCNDKMRCNSTAVGSLLLSTVFVLLALAARIFFA